MITNSRRSYKSESIKESRKDYYLIIDNHRPMGVCTSFEIAQACAKCFAEKHNAKEVDGNDVYIYEDESGRHLISIETIKRIRMPYSLDED